MAQSLTDASRRAIRFWQGKDYLTRHSIFEKRVVYDSRADWQFGCTSGSAGIGSGTFDLRPATRTRDTVKEWWATDRSLRSPEYTGTVVTSPSYVDGSMGSPNPGPTFTGATGTGTTFDSDGGIETAIAAGTGRWLSPYIDTLLNPEHGSYPYPSSFFHYDSYTKMVFTKTGAAAANLALYLPFEGSTAQVLEAGCSPLGGGMVRFSGSGTGTNAAGTQASRGTGVAEMRCLPFGAPVSGTPSGGRIFVPPAVLNGTAGWFGVWMNLYASPIGTVDRRLLVTFFDKTGSTAANRMYARFVEDLNDSPRRVVFAMAGSGAAGTLTYNSGTWSGWRHFLFGWGTFGKRIFVDGILVANHATYGYPLGNGTALVCGVDSNTGPAGDDYAFFDDATAHTAWDWASNDELYGYFLSGKLSYKYRWGATTVELSGATYYEVAPTWPIFALDVDALGSAVVGKRYFQIAVDGDGGTASPP